MAYMGSAAYRLDNVEHRRYQDDAGSFEVVQGGGLDARARRGVSEEFLAKLRVFVICVVAIVALGTVRVALSVAAVSNMRDNVTLQTSIDEARDTNTDLRVMDAQLSAASRIDAIATQNYGMIPSTEALSATATNSLEKSDSSAQATSSSKVSQTKSSGSASSKTKAGEKGSAKANRSSAVNAQSSAER